MVASWCLICIPNALAVAVPGVDSPLGNQFLNSCLSLPVLIQTVLLFVFSLASTLWMQIHCVLRDYYSFTM